MAIRGLHDAVAARWLSSGAVGGRLPMVEELACALEDDGSASGESLTLQEHRINRPECWPLCRSVLNAWLCCCRWRAASCLAWA